MTNRASPHPFRGGIAYPWDRPEVLALYKTLSRGVTLPGHINILARTYALDEPLEELERWVLGRPEL